MNVFDVALFSETALIRLGIFWLYIPLDIFLVWNQNFIFCVLCYMSSLNIWWPLNHIIIALNSIYQFLPDGFILLFTKKWFTWNHICRQSLREFQLRLKIASILFPFTLNWAISFFFFFNYFLPFYN